MRLALGGGDWIGSNTVWAGAGCGGSVAGMPGAGAVVAIAVGADAAPVVVGVAVVVGAGVAAVGSEPGVLLHGKQHCPLTLN